MPESWSKPGDLPFGELFTYSFCLDLIFTPVMSYISLLLSSSFTLATSVQFSYFRKILREENGNCLVHLLSWARHIFANNKSYNIVLIDHLHHSTIKLALVLM